VTGGSASQFIKADPTITAVTVAKTNVTVDSNRLFEGKGIKEFLTYYPTSTEDKHVRFVTDDGPHKGLYLCEILQDPRVIYEFWSVDSFGGILSTIGGFASLIWMAASACIDSF